MHLLSTSAAGGAAGKGHGHELTNGNDEDDDVIMRHQPPTATGLKQHMRAATAELRHRQRMAVHQPGMPLYVPRSAADDRLNFGGLYAAAAAAAAAAALSPPFGPAAGSKFDGGLLATSTVNGPPSAHFSSDARSLSNFATSRLLIPDSLMSRH